MHETHSLRERFLVFFKIFVPILIYQFANFSAAFVDTTMTGQYDTLHLAGVAMATSLWSPFFTFLTGIVSALVPIIGHHLGAGRKDRVAPDFYQLRIERLDQRRFQVVGGVLASLVSLVPLTMLGNILATVPMNNIQTVLSSSWVLRLLINWNFPVSQIIQHLWTSVI